MLDTRQAGTLPRVPVHDRDPIHEAPRHRDRGHVARPDLIRTVNDKIPQPVRIDLVRLIGQAEVALRVPRCQIHRAYQTPDLLAVHPMTSILQPIADASTAIEGMFQVTAIDQRHPFELSIRNRLGHVIERRARQI